MSDTESKDESVQAPKTPPPAEAAQINKCEQCERPAAHRSRFCELHRGRAKPVKIPKKRSVRLDVVLAAVMVVVFGVWMYPKFMRTRSAENASKVGTAEQAVAANRVPLPAAKPGGAAKPVDSKADASVAPAETKQDGRPAPPKAGVATDPMRVASTQRGTCGNGIVEAGEQCDGQALAGATCASLGFSGDCGPEDGCLRPGLTCLASCKFDYSGCTTETQVASQRFVDQGNGTAVDRLTGLTWEMKCDGSCPEAHNVLATLPWAGAASQWVASLNEEKFAGHNDWRLPSLEELRSLLAAVPPCANEPCAKSVWPRQLTASAPYWSSTTFSIDKHRAWAVSFRDGEVYTAEKSEALHARAVRDGS